MYVCTESSDTAHPHFWHKCLPKDEEIENTQKLKYLKKFTRNLPEKIYLHFTRKDMKTLQKKARQQLGKKGKKTAKLKNWLSFL